MTEARAPYDAYFANSLFFGEKPLELGSGAWVLGFTQLTLDGYQVELRQQPWVIRERSWRDLCGQWRHTTDVRILEVAESERERASEIVHRLAELLSLATASEVAIAGWDHAVGANTGFRQSTCGGINYFLPVIDTRDGEAIRTFLESTWDTYVREHQQRNLAAVFHYLALAEREGTPVEPKLAVRLIVLEQLKHSFAVGRNYVFIKPRFHAPGTITPTKKSGRGLEKLLHEMFGEVGMQPSLSPIVDLRNEILHSGLSARSFSELTAMDGEITALIREYVLRLIGFEGEFLTGQSGGVRAFIA